MALRSHDWQPQTPRCCSCDKTLDVVRQDGAISAGAGFLPNLPGAVCNECLDHVEGLAVTELHELAAGHFLRTCEFELKTRAAVQVFLDLYGWAPEVVAGGAMRLFVDAKQGDARALLKAAIEHGEQPDWFRVELAHLLLLDGETGQAHDLLTATDAGSHPRWHLNHGVLAYSVGRPDAAYQHWLEQIAAHPEEPLGWTTLGFHLYRERGEVDAAEKLYREACAAFPERMEFRAWLGDTLRAQGRLEEALTELEASLKLEPVDDEFTRGVEGHIAQLRTQIAEGS